MVVQRCAILRVIGCLLQLAPDYRVGAICRDRILRGRRYARKVRHAVLERRQCHVASALPDDLFHQTFLRSRFRRFEYSGEKVVQLSGCRRTLQRRHRILPPLGRRAGNRYSRFGRGFGDGRYCLPHPVMRGDDVEGVDEFPAIAFSFGIDVLDQSLNVRSPLVHRYLAMDQGGEIWG